MDGGVGITDVGQSGQSAQTGNDLLEDFKPLTGSVGRPARQSGDIATRSRQTRDDPGADRIAGRCEHDGDRRCRLFSCERRWGVVCENESDLALDEFGCDFTEPLSVCLAPAIVDHDIGAFVPCWTKLAKAASILRSLPTDKMRGSMPDACAAVCTSLIWDSEVGFPGLVRKPMTLALGTSSRIIPNRFAPSVL